MTERLLATRQVAEALNVPQSAIRDWKTRGRAVPADFIRGRGRGGLVPLYKLDDLRPLAAAYHQRLTRRADSENPD